MTRCCRWTADELVRQPAGGEGHRPRDRQGALRAIQRQPWGRTAGTLDGVVVTTSPTGRGRELTEFLVGAGFTPDAVSERAQDLEEVFLELTGGETR